jgi:ubiquinol-cytochrome c reductase cytochrome b subunit
MLSWFDERTGLLTALGNWMNRPIAGGPAWRFVWPTTIAFCLVVQAITGLVLWMYYSAGAQSSWESVYYLQYHVLGGCLLRAIHFYTGQATLVLVGIYLLQMILRGAYRGPRELLFWSVLLMGLATLALNVTGDLLPWDQNSYWAGQIRVAYLSHTPVVGPWLAKLAIGGEEFGKFTITRFLALHIGVCTSALVLLVLLHAHLAARHGLEAAGGEGSPLGVPYWPRQAWRDAAACCVVMAVVVGLSARHGVTGPQAGIELGAPANPVDGPGTARPEWSFRGLYELHELLAARAWPEMVSIMVIPGLAVLLFFAMPWIGRPLSAGGLGGAGRALNIVLALVIFGGTGVLAWQSYSEDAKNDKYQAALTAGREQAERVKELAAGPEKIPVSGALTLLQNDAKTQGPLLFSQHCASCHDYSGPATGIARPAKPTAADLYGFAGRAWLTEFLTANGISSPKNFGNTKFKHGKMYEFIKETYAGFKPNEKEQIVAALSREADLKSQREADTGDEKKFAAGRQLIKENCSGCHAFHDKRGDEGKGPMLTGYGSREWIIGIMSKPAHDDFYGKQNDRMPAFAESATDTKNNRLTRQQLELLAEWLRGEWFEKK